MKNPKSNGCGSNVELLELPYAIAMQTALRSEREMGRGEIQLVLGYKDDTVDHDLVVNVARHRSARMAISAPSGARSLSERWLDAAVQVAARPRKFNAWEYTEAACVYGEENRSLPGMFRVSRLKRQVVDHSWIRPSAVSGQQVPHGMY